MKLKTFDPDTARTGNIEYKPYIHISSKHYNVSGLGWSVGIGSTTDAMKN